MSDERAPAKDRSPVTGDLVICRFEGTGRVWPPGHHVRSGEVFKHGPAGGWLVRIMHPILERQSNGEWRESRVITCAEHEMEVVP